MAQPTASHAALRALMVTSLPNIRDEAWASGILASLVGEHFYDTTVSLSDHLLSLGVEKI